MTVGYVVRDVAGSARRGSFPEGDPSTIYVSHTKDVSLNINPADVASYQRLGSDLVISLSDGQVLVLHGYFDASVTGEKGLYLSQQGEIVEVALAGDGEGALVANLQELSVGEKWSPYDQLVFLDLADIQPVVAPLVAPLAGSLGGIAAGGAALVGGAALAGGVGGGGGGGDGGGGSTVIQPTVDDADATHLVGGTVADSATVSGTGAPGSEVVVDIGGQTQTVIVADDGTWSATFDTTGLPGDGVYDAAVSVVDPDGNTFDLDGPSIDIDLTAPSVTVLSGTQATGDLVNGETYGDGATITGTGEPGATVEVTIGGATQSAIVDDQGAWSVTFAPAEVAEGEYNTEITLVTTDARGNSATSTDVLVVDTVAPVAQLDVVEGDNVISAAEAADGVTLSGTGEAGATVSVEFQGLTRSVTVDGDGVWSIDYTASEIAAGTYDSTVTITTTDIAGNSSVSTHNVHVDTEQSLSLNAEVGGDYVINAAEQAAGVTFTGAAEPGSTVVVTIGAASQTVTAGVDGSWSAGFAPGDIPEGTYETTVSAVATDSAGNTETSTQTVRVDTENAVSLDSPQAGDDVINAQEAAAGVTLTGTAEPGASVEVTMQGVTHTAVADGAGVWSAVFAPADIAPGEYDAAVTVTSTDVAGNVSTTTGTVRVDTATSISMDAGDGLINAAEQAAGVTFTGAAEPGASVVVTMGAASHTVTAGADGSWSAAFQSSEIPEGTYETTVTAVATDSAGNSETTTQSVRVDTENAVALDSPQAGDDVISAAEAAAGVTLTGTAEPGATVEVSLQGVTHAVTADATGAWSAVFATGEIAPGEYDAAVAVTATDVAGNVSTTTGTVRVDTETTISINASDGVINATEQAAGVTFAGAAEPGASVVVSLGAASQTVTAGADGSWSAAFASGDIPAGTYEATLTAVATDAVGNTETTTRSVRVDTENAVALDSPQAGDDVINGAEAAAGVALTGTAEPGASVNVTLQGVSHTVTAAANGTWSAFFTSAEIPPGEYDAPISVTSTDAAGNTSSASGSVHVDTQTAVSIAPGPAGGDSIVNAAEAQAGVTFTGLAEPGASVQVTVAGVTRSATVDPSGNWSALFAGGVIPQGEYDTTIQVVATDAAGNTANSSTSLRVDTNAGQVAISPLPIEIDDVINAVERADGVVINGTATPGLTVTVGLGAATQQVVANPAGAWSATFPAADIPTGTETLPITASITDAAGNSATATDSVGLDTVVDSYSLAAGPIEGDDVINEAERADGVTLTGTVEPGATVVVQLGGVSQAATVDGAGNWSVTFAASSIPQGTYDADVTVTATDRAGNTDVLSDTVRVDTEAQLTSAPNQTDDDVINAAERLAGVELTGTAEPGATVSVDLLGVTRAAVVDASGNWTASFAPGEIPEGTYSASATITATDLAGNSATVTESFNVDTEVDSPNVDSVTFSGPDVWRVGTLHAEGSYSINTLEPGGTIGNPDSIVTQHPVLGTEFTFTSAVPDGTNLVVSRVDDAGNTSATLVVLEDGAGAASTVGHAGLGAFDLQGLNLDYGENTNLVLNEAQIRALSDSSDTLTIHGGNDDTVTVAGAVDTGLTRDIDGQTYNVYTLGNDGTTLVIEEDINVII